MISPNFFWDIILSSFRRLYARKVIAITVILGLTVAISLFMSVSLYTDGIYYQSFLDNVTQTRENPAYKQSQINPTFAFLFHYHGGWHGTKTWDELAAIDSFLTRKGVAILDIPAIDMVRLFETNTFYVFPQDNSRQVNSLYLSQTSFGVINNFERHVQITKGRFSLDGSPIEIIVNANLARRSGLRVGGIYLAYFKTESAAGDKETIHLPIKVVGIWRPVDPTEDYWIFAPSYYENILFTNERAFFSQLGSNFPKFIYNAYWYLVMDADDVHAEEVGGLINRINRLEMGANELEPNLWLSISPKKALQDYSEDARVLRILFYAFGIPILGLILAFIGMVSNLSSEQQQLETSIVRSRGGTIGQILGFTTLEGIILGITALLLSLPLGMWLTRVISKTQGFSNFAGMETVRIDPSNGTFRVGMVAVVIFLVILLLPTLKAARHTIITHRLNKIQQFTSPWWQRAYMDILLFIPSAYGLYILQKQGSLATPGAGSLGYDPFRNPLLFLVPSLGILSLSLFSIRIIRLVLIFLDRLASRTSYVGLVFAIRHIARKPANYSTPLIILILTTSMFTYTASLSTTLDQHLTAQEFYKTGSDVRFFDPGDSTVSGDSTRWDFFPVDEYTRINGVHSATRVGRYAAQIKTTRIEAKGIFMGIDRLAFPAAAYWRDDFAGKSLGALMNILAQTPDNVLVNSDFIQLTGLKTGDKIQVVVKTYNQFTNLNLKIAGTVDYFPTWYPEQGPLLVGNLEYLFENALGIFPYYVFLKTTTSADPRTIQSEQLRAMDHRIRPVDWETPIQNIQNAHRTPERQGLTGFLFIGLMTAVLLTVLAFLLHLVFSFEQRSIELGVIRAVGLSIHQMVSILIWEFIFLILSGSSIGTVLGLLASKTFIPYLQIGEGTAARIPPFQVLIPWDLISQIFWLFTFLFTSTLVISVLLLRRIKIFEMIKLGETI